MTCQACYNGPAIAVMAKEQTDMTTKTYTLLVTITNDRAIEAEDLAEHVAAVLEVGCEGWSGVSSATVDAVAGDQLFGGAEFGAHIKALHAELRA